LIIIEPHIKCFYSCWVVINNNWLLKYHLSQIPSECRNSKLLQIHNKI
jgi:hypothetical protein